MNLLIISGMLGIGGAERFVSNLLSFIDHKKVNASLCLLENRIDYPIPENISISVIPSNKLNYFQKISCLKTVIEEKKPDIIVSNIALVNRLTGAALRKIDDSPHWIARIGNHPAKGGRSWIRNQINMRWDKYAYKAADRFIVNSKGLLKGLSVVHPCSVGKTTVIYNPIDFCALEREATLPPLCLKPKNRQLIIAVGRFHRQKRYDLLIKSFSAIIRKQQNVELWICGDGYLRGRIENDILKYNLKNNIRLLGHTDNPFPLMRQADLFLMTSDWEGMPNALVEAMGLGIAAVATDCEFGPGEIIEHEVSGLLAAPGNVEQITAMSLDLLKNSEKRRKIAESGKNRVRALFDRKKIIDQWTEFLRI